MGKRLIPGTIVKIVAGQHKGKAGKIAGELNADGLYPVIIDGRVRNVMAKNLEAKYGNA